MRSEYRSRMLVRGFTFLWLVLAWMLASLFAQIFGLSTSRFYLTGLALTCAWPIVWAFLVYRRLVRSQREGDYRWMVCPVCKYNLRGSKDRCPECGTPIPPGE